MACCDLIYYNIIPSINAREDDNDDNNKQRLKSANNKTVAQRNVKNDSDHLFLFHWKKCNIEDILEAVLSDKKNVIVSQQVRQYCFGKLRNLYSFKLPN